MEIGKKIFKFKGKTLEELKTLDVREFAKLLKARQRRTVLRTFQDHEKFIARIKKKAEKNKQIKTHKRDFVVVPEMVGLKIQVYKGNAYIPIEITGDMLGHKLGEFALTRSKTTHSGGGTGATKGSKAKTVR